MKLTCPKCEFNYHLPDTFGGKIRRCPSCETSWTQEGEAFASAERKLSLSLPTKIAPTPELVESGRSPVQELEPEPEPSDPPAEAEFVPDYGLAPIGPGFFEKKITVLAGGMKGFAAKCTRDNIMAVLNAPISLPTFTKRKPRGKNTSIAARHIGAAHGEIFSMGIRRTPWFAISAGTHLLLLFLATFIVLYEERAKNAHINIAGFIVSGPEEALIEEKEPERERVEAVPIEETEPELQDYSRTDEGVDDLFEPIRTEVETHFENVGDPENRLDNSQIATPDAFLDPVGVTNGSGGGFGKRAPRMAGVAHPGSHEGKIGFSSRNRGEERMALLKEHGGDEKTEAAVERALKWLARHQEANGSWPYLHPQLGPMGDKGEALARIMGDRYVTALTGLAALAFLGAGHTPSDATSEFRNNIKNALQYLISKQQPEGCFEGSCNYGNAIATMALCEAAGMGYYEADIPAKRAIDWLIKAQRPEGGWDYQDANGKPGRNDNSVTGWCVMALRSAWLAGIPYDYKKIWQQVDKYLSAAVRVKNKDSSDAEVSVCYHFGLNVHGPGRMVVRPKNMSKQPEAGSLAMHETGLLMLLYSGMKANTPVVRVLAEKAIKELATARGDSYTTYYAFLSVFMTGPKGEFFQRFNAEHGPELVKTQRQGEPDVDGSWDPMALHDFAGGRVMTTALKCMCLQVYYRYATVFTGKQKR